MHSTYDTESREASDSVGLSQPRPSEDIRCHPLPSADHQKSLEWTIRRPWSGHHMLKVYIDSHVGQWWLVRKEKIERGIVGGRPSRRDDPKKVSDPKEPVVQRRGGRCVGVMFHQRVGLVKRLKRVKDPEEPVVRWRGCVPRKRDEKTSKSLLFNGEAGFRVFRFLEFLHIYQYTGRGTKPVSGSPQGHSRRVEELLRRMLLAKRMRRRTSGGAPAAEKTAGSPWYKATRIGEARIPGPCEKERRRGTKPKFQDIVLLNTSGMPQMNSAMMHFKKDYESIKTAALVIQEHHVGKEHFSSLQLGARSSQWHLQGAPAVQLSSGKYSAGVCVAARRHINLGMPPGWDHDISTAASPGRLCAAWLEGVIKGGLLIISIYLWDGEGMSDRNKEILEQAGLHIKMYGGPWLIAGDFNMTPEQLNSGAGAWLLTMGAIVIQPEGMTCRSSGGGRTIDYCIIDHRISGTVKSIKVDNDFPSSPHFPVRIRVRGGAAKELVTVLKAPAMFENARPIGCERRPAEGTGLRQKTEDKFDRLALVATTEGGKEEGSELLSKIFEEVLDNAESQPCHLFDKVDENGSPMRMYCGRSKGLQVVSRTALLPMEQEHGKCDPATKGLLWIKRALLDIIVIIKGSQQGKEMTAHKLRHWNAIANKFRTPPGDVQALLREEFSEKWKFRLDAMQTVQHSSYHCVRTLAIWAQEANSQAAQRTAETAAKAARKWWQWVDEQLRVGAGALHAYTKRDEKCAQALTPVSGPHGPTLAIQAMLDSDREAWKQIWSRFEGETSAPWRSATLPTWAGELPTLDGSSIAKAAKKFKRKTSLGCDAFHPRWLCWLTGDVLQTLAKLLMTIEKWGIWPGMVKTILVMQIPKSDGGRRPIGLLPTLVRVWEKARKPIVEAWRSSVERGYNFAAKGKSSETAAWVQAHNAEVAISNGGFSAATLLDLTKAFEMVKLELIWLAGLSMHFPPVILRLILEAFSFARRLTLFGAISDPIFTLSSILAGGGYATDALFIIMVGVCDGVLSRNPGVDLCLFVDDIALHATGRSEAEVTCNLESAVSDCIATLEVGLGMVVSRGKRDSKTVAIHCKLSKACKKRFAKNMKALGIKINQQAKLLGVDFSAGKRIRRSTQRKRIVKICRRKKRYQQLGKKAANHVVRTGAGPGFKYGAGVYGASTSAIKAVRSFSCNAIGEMRGRSSFARLALAGYDAGGLMAIEPIVQWAKAVWDSLVPRDDMKVSWKAAMTSVVGAARPFSKVSGPAGAMVASARRLGWEIPAPFHLRMNNGTIISMDAVSPKDIHLLAVRALRHKESPSSSLAIRNGFPPDLEPLKGFLHSIRRTKAAASLRSLGEGGWWTQDRMHAAELRGVTDDACKACHDQVGTLYHRCCGCSKLRPLMDSPEGQKHNIILGEAASAVHCQEALFQYGMPQLAEPLEPPPLVVRWCGGIEVDDFCFTGDVFSDGSVLHGFRKGNERAGWAAVMINGEGKVISGIYGTCPDYFPTSLRAELWGVLQTLRHGCPPITIWVDNAGVVEGFAKGESWCCSSSRAAADLWRLVWWKVRDLGTDDIQVVKVKGHATQVDVDEGNVTAWQREGNGHADHFAGRGSMLAEELSSTEADKETFRKARKWYSWLALLAINWPKDTQPKVQRSSRHRAPEDPTVGLQLLQRKRSRSRDRCSKGASRSKEGLGAGHDLFQSGALVWCRRCGAYGEQRFKSLKGTCQGAAGKGPRAGQLARLVKGEHPLKKGVRMPLPVRYAGQG